MTLKIVFMGSPKFSIPTLTNLIKEYQVVGVVTQPDKPAGRGKKILAPPVKELVMDHGIPVIQPKRLRDPESFEQLVQWNPDLIVVVAFGQILRENVLNLPKYGCINVHASLLPRWRGSAPIQASIYHGDEETGVTIMKMDAGIDSGPTLTQRSLFITEKDTSESLSEKLAVLGADLLIETLPKYISGEIQPRPQPEEGITTVSMIKKEDGQLDFSRTAVELINHIKAYNPWPGTFFDLDQDRIKIHWAEIHNPGNLKSGQRDVLNGFPVIGTGQGDLILKIVQPAGKKPMDGDVFLRGFRRW